MSARIVVIAATKEEGEAKYPNAAAIVTPRSRDAAEGIAADRVIVTGSMRDHAELAEIRQGIRDALGNVADMPRKSRTVETVGKGIGHRV